jgi:aryl-alcohol dehydrogenase-like predicted oxidoreductase
LERNASLNFALSASVIATDGVSKPDHLDEALATIGVRLSADENAAFEEPCVPYPAAGVA